MVEKCKNCGEPIVKFPIRDKVTGKIIWKNMFKMSIDSIILFLVIAAMVIAYKHDIAKCNKMIEDPIGYCDRTNACKILEQQQYIDNEGNIMAFPINLPKNENGHIP